MKEILRLQEKNFEICKQKFGMHLPRADTSLISYKDLPQTLKLQINGTKNCGISLQILHSDESKTLITEYKDYDVFYLQDRDQNNRFNGEGRVFIESGLEGEIPVVGYTRTSKKYREKGLGTRRLFIMNALSNAMFDSPIYSSGSPRIAQKSIWEKLIKQEYAEITEFEGTQRYKFI